MWSKSRQLTGRGESYIVEPRSSHSQTEGETIVDVVLQAIARINVTSVAWEVATLMPESKPRTLDTTACAAAMLP